MIIMWMFVAQGASAASSSQSAIAACNSANWDAVAAVASALSVVVAISGVVLIIRQIAQNSRQMRGQLISDLEDQLHKHFDIYHQRFAPGGQFSMPGDGPELTAEEIPGICSYLSFFEKVYLLIEERMIGLRTIDRLFAYRFFRVVNDLHVQKQILYKQGLGSYFASIFELYEIWEEYRLANGLEILGTSQRLTFPANLD